MSNLNEVNLRFNCKVYKEGVVRENQQFAAYGEKIQASLRFNNIDEIPDDMKPFAKEFNNEKDGNIYNMYYVNVKIFPKNCKFFSSKRDDDTGMAKQIQCPKYDWLDGENILCSIMYSVKNRGELVSKFDPVKNQKEFLQEAAEFNKRPNGVYINGLQFIRRSSSVIFEANENGEDFENLTKKELNFTSVPEIKVPDVPDNEYVEDLPF